MSNCEIKGRLYDYNTCFMSLRSGMSLILAILQNQTMCGLQYLIAMSMFEKLVQKSKYSRLRRKLKKLYLEDEHWFNFTLYYLYSSLFPNREEIEKMESKTISVPLYSLVKIDATTSSVETLASGKIKLNRELHEEIIPLSDDFRIQVLNKLKELFISIYIKKEENPYSFFFL